jgi:hypothetical protein
MNAETRLQNKIIVGCADIAYLYRYQVGKFLTPDGRIIKIGIKGFDDLFGFRLSDGKFIVLEIKLPNKTRSPEQIKFGDAMSKQNIIYGVVHNLDEAKYIISVDK